MAFVHAWKWLVERLTTYTAAIAAALNTDPNTFASNRQVHEQFPVVIPRTITMLEAMAGGEKWSDSTHFYD